MSGMKAVVLTGHGGLDKLVYHEDWPIPEPGPGEVRVKVGACGLNNTDINTRTAWYSKSVTDAITEEGGQSGYDTADETSGGWGSSGIVFPRIQGADVAGYIDEVGSDVDNGIKGQRVLLDPWWAGPGGSMKASDVRYFGSEVDGGFAEYAVVPAQNAIPIDCSLSDAELATFPCAYGTAENLVTHVELQSGETVVISGASGGVGSAAIQLCRLRGARVIAIASAEKESLLKELGADIVIDRRSESIEDSVRAVADDDVAAAIDVVGGPMFMPLINALQHGGRYSSAGSIAGPMVEFDLRQLIYKDLTLSGATIVPAGTMQRVVDWIEQGNLKPLLAETFPLRDLGLAQTEFLKKKHVGNLVVNVPG